MSILNESVAGRSRTFGVDSTTPIPVDLSPRDGRSYVQGPSVPPLVYATIPQMLADTVSRYGPRDALGFPDRRLS